jgi:asparagine synthase (glutamine-hydrolysing)
MSMATSIESRVPFLDHTFVEFASRVPQQYKLNGSTGKYLIKKVAEQLIPHSAIYRKKMGFPTPLRLWLRDARMQPALDSMLDHDGFLASVVDTNAVAPILERHRSGQLDATDRLWRLLNLHLWGEMQIAKRRSPEDALLGVAAAV